MKLIIILRIRLEKSRPKSAAKLKDHLNSTRHTFAAHVRTMAHHLHLTKDQILELRAKHLW